MKKAIEFQDHGFVIEPLSQEPMALPGAIDLHGADEMTLLEVIGQANGQYARALGAGAFEILEGENSGEAVQSKGWKVRARRLSDGLLVAKCEEECGFYLVDSARRAIPVTA